ncbi:hypothetical protein TNCV_1557241 [Trichonephila clavipes]|nr:hypothetical protein TNCV_1557241 [Trichonephila clavipes]
MASEGCYKLLIHSAKQIVQVVKNGERVVVGKALNNVAVLEKEENSSGLSIVVSSCTRASGDGPRNFEPWPRDVDDT